MSIFESILYGLISGLTEFLPVSARAHQALFRFLSGSDAGAPLQELLVHIGVLLAVILSCGDILSRLRREQKRISSSRRRTRSLDNKSLFDLRLLKTATVPLVLGLCLYFATASISQKMVTMMVFMFLNGFVLMLADHTRRGNRDARTMSGLDGIIMGLLGALSVFPGISRTGMISAYTSMRGADFQNATGWAILLTIPAMIFAVLYDFICIVSRGFGVDSFIAVIGSVLSGICAFGGGYAGISLLRALLNHSGFSKFAYYSIGMGMFTFILYLIT